MDRASAKVTQVKTSGASKDAVGERKGSGSDPSNRRGSLVPPEETGRRPSLIISDGGNRRLRPGEVAADKKGRKQSLVNEDKFNQESTPLQDIGEVGPPKIVDMFECYPGVEGETGYISVQVQGIPAPTFKFYYKGVTPLIEGVRCKFHTDGETNTVTLCLRNIKANDEGKYKIVFTNCHGTISDETQLYVSKPGCVDFRTLLRKSKYAKWGKDKSDPKWGDLKGVQKAQDQFVNPLQNQNAKEGKDKKVEFVAKFSKQNAKPKWFYRQDELFMGVKHKFRNDGDMYYLSVLNPKLADSGKYTIDIAGVQSSAILTVEAPDPSYKFIRPLNKKYDGFTKHELSMECKVSDSIAIVSWYKGETKLSSDTKYFIDKDLAGVCTLQIKSCELNDTADFRCQLERQPDKTETKVKVVEYPYKFLKCLKSQQNVEKDTVTLACELDDPLGDVKWLKNGKEIKPDANVEIIKDGRKRKVIIKDAKLTDAGQYTCVSNADKTEADLTINKQNKFNKELKDTVAVEREKLVLDIELEDEKAPAEWKFNGKPIKRKDGIEIKNLGGGKHQLVFNNLKMADAGEISVVSGKLSSSCKLIVQKGESKPQMDAPKEIEGSVGKPLVLEVPFKIDGKKQTPIEASLIKDGKPLSSKDVEVQIKDEKVIFTIKKPTCDQSGSFQVKLSNGQGDDLKDVKITIQDVPNAPQDVNVRDVFEKSCIVDWQPPKENGGTPIQKYIIEREDVSSKKGWENVGEVPADKPTTFKVEDLTPNKTYKFRIRAVNKIGSSEPVEYKINVLAKNPWDAPGKPKSLEITDVDNKSAKLKWIKPDNDGGAEITEYEIEVKEKGSKDWIKKKRVPASEASTTIDDLKEGQQYEFRVRAVNKAGPGEPSDATKPIVAKNPWEAPGKPKGLEISDVDNKSAKLKWIKPDSDGGAEITEYEIEVKDKDNKNWVKKKRVPASEASTTIDDLKEGQQYEFRVRAVNKAGPGDPSDATKPIVAKNPWEAPGKPKGLEVTDVDNKSAKIKWIKPENDGGAEITEYEIEVKDKDNKDWVKKKRVPASEASTTIDDLKEGQQYEFRVRAVNKAGPGEPSDATKPIVAKNPWEAPGKPKGLEVTDVDNKSAKIKWIKPENDGGAEITEYEIEVKDKDNKDWVKKKRVPASEASTTIDDLKEGQQYEFRVRAVNKAGPGKPSDATKPIVAKNPWEAPGKPKGLEVTDVDNKSAKIKWIKPENDGGAEITEYEIEVKDKDSKDWVKKKRVPASEASTTIDDLKEGQQYEFRVRAVNKAGPGEPSDATKPIVAKNPWEAPGKPKGLEVTDVDNKSAKIKWIKPENDGGAEITEYEIEVKEKDSKDWVKKKRVPASEASTTIDDLKEGQQYEFRVRAVNKAGPGEPSDATKPIVAKNPWEAPGKPKGLEVTDVDNKSAKIKWIKPENDGGAEITEYEIEVKDKDSKDWVKKKRVPVSEASTTIDDLKEGQQYEFRVRAVNKAGPGEPSDATKPIVAKNPWEAPGKPKGLEVTDVDNKSAKIKWIKPENDGGAEITEYEIEVKDKDSKDWVKKKRVPASEASTTIDDLKEGQQYEFRVRAVNKAGPGEPSDATKPIVAKNPWEAPGKPKGLEVTDVDNKSAKIKWIKPENDGGAEITEYEIEVKEKDSKDWVKKKRVPASEASTTIDDLKEGQQYEFRVRAVNKAGPGEPSDATKPIVAKNPWEAPGKPKGLEVTDVDNKSAKIKWIKPENDGGAEITEYEIEVKEKDSKDWVKKKRVPASEASTTIDDLKEGQQYEFRIRAVNKAGPGEPSDATKPIVAKNPWEAPGKPKGLEVTDVDSKSAKLNWIQPENDGGAEITEYEIEVKEKGGKNWVKKKRVQASEASTTIDDLKEGQQYEFRVRAINKAGPGEPSDATKPIIARKPLVKPFITGDQLKNFVIKKGEQFKYDINYGGEPEPEIKWQKDTKVLKADGDHIKIEKAGGNTILTVQNGVRSDSGKYKLILINSSGRFESVGEVIVLDKPTPPKGPLKVTNVHESGCKLMWRKSDDDGGVQIKKYKIEKLVSETNEWSLVSEVSIETTEYTVTGLSAGPSYKFRVSAVNDEGESDSLVTENWTITKKTTETTLVEFQNVAGTEGVETCTTMRKDISGELETTTKTTVKTTTTKSQTQEGNRTFTRTVKQIVTRTEREEEYEEEEEEEEGEEEEVY